jgi:hypothetical protein
MSFTIKVRTLPGSPMLCEYDCVDCGRFEQIALRDTTGNPPDLADCPECGESSALAISAPSIKFWSRDPVPINPAGATRHQEKDPRALDTEPLATGKMTKQEWRKWQRGISQERRHQKRLKSGRISKRIQVGGG